MGPGNESRSDSPSRPRFKWDLRTCPWTAGKRSRDGYAAAVLDCSEYHDLLSNSNSNKIPSNIRGLQFKSQLFDCAADLIYDIARSTRIAENSADAIVKSIYKRDTMSVVTDVFNEYTKLMNT